MAVLVYLVKTTVVFVTLFSLYNVFLKDITFLKIRRWYLNGIVLLSFLIPGISPFIFSRHDYPEFGPFLTETSDFIRGNAITSWLTESWAIDFINTLVIIVIAVSFILVTTKYVWGLVGMFRFLKKSIVVSKNEQFVLRMGHKGKGCFSFVKTIYLYSPALNEQNIDIILEHEMAHVRQRHYIDTWLSAICDYFFWLHPFTGRFQKALEEVLECSADREAINNLRIKPITYQTALYAGMEYSGMQAGYNNAFGRSMIVQRLSFISKKPSCLKSVPIRLFIPFLSICALTVGFAFVDVKISQVEKINSIRNAGYEPNHVTMGYVIDNETEEPIENVIVRPEKGGTPAITDHDGFFFIKKAGQSKLSIQHIAYRSETETLSKDLIIRAEPSNRTIVPEQTSNRLNKKSEKTITASFSPGEENYREYLSKNMQYPEEALINKINGTVWVTAEIDAEGKVKNVKLHQGIQEDLNKEAIRLVENMPDWNSALQNNIRSNVQVLIPVTFTL